MAVLKMAVSAAAGYLGALLGKVTEGTAGEVGEEDLSVDRIQVQQG